MTVMRSISKLTTSVDHLTDAANLTKVQLNAKVATTQAEVPAAQAEQSATEAARDVAGIHATDAETHLATVKAGVTYAGIDVMLAAKAMIAVDLFVYDTSLDSDGGAWRKRCQHTSWFAEPLNTNTRGGRREFPAVAVIVAEADKVTILDGDDPALPMWMVANRLSINGWNWISYSNDASASSIAAINGIISIGANNASGSRTGLTVANFLSDQVFRHDSGGKMDLYSIAKRSIGHPDDTISEGSLVDALVNDVAMIVLPDAPIDPATGLPVPTIAVATDGGFSVIKDNGAVVDLLNAGSNRGMRVAFGVHGKLFIHDAHPSVSGYGAIRQFNIIPVLDEAASATADVEYRPSADGDYKSYARKLVMG